MDTPTTKLDRLQLDIDTRIVDLWEQADSIEEWDLYTVAAFMRAAYGKGYCDSLMEPSPGILCREHGYKVPQRRRT
jgi:hypothetical protein